MKTFVETVPKEFLVSKLRLDPNNPRLKLLPGGNSEREIIERLCRLGSQSPSQVVKHILTDRGFLHNAAPVVFKAEGARDAIVIDGNRRMAAVKMILNPALVPSTRKGLRADCEKLQGLVPEKLRCWVTRSASDAKRIVYRAHNEGSQEWNTLCKYSAHYEYYKEGQEIKDIVEITGSDFRKVVMEINTWLLVEAMLKHIPDFQMESEGITSFERVTTSYSGFPAKIGVSVTSEGVYELPDSTDLAELLYKIYLKSAKASGFSRQVENNDKAREKWLNEVIPSDFRPSAPRTPGQPAGAEDKGGAPGPKSNAANPNAASKKGAPTLPSLPSVRDVLLVRKNVGPKAFEIFKEYCALPEGSDFPIAAAALTRAMIETTLKHHAKRLKCYDETPDQQLKGQSDMLDSIANKLKKEVASMQLPYKADLLSAIGNASKCVGDLNEVMHKDTCFSARMAVKTSLAALAAAVENLVKIPTPS